MKIDLKLLVSALLSWRSSVVEHGSHGLPNGIQEKEEGKKQKGGVSPPSPN